MPIQPTQWYPLMMPTTLCSIWRPTSALPFRKFTFTAIRPIIRSIAFICSVFRPPADCPRCPMVCKPPFRLHCLARRRLNFSWCVKTVQPHWFHQMVSFRRKFLHLILLVDTGLSLHCASDQVMRWHEWAANQTHTLDLRFITTSEAYSLVLKMSLVNIPYNPQRIEGIPPAFTTMLGDPLTFPPTTTTTTITTTTTTTSSIETTKQEKMSTTYLKLPTTSTESRSLHLNSTSRQQQSQQQTFPTTFLQATNNLSTETDDNSFLYIIIIIAIVVFIIVMVAVIVFALKTTNKPKGKKQKREN